MVTSVPSGRSSKSTGTVPESQRKPEHYAARWNGTSWLHRVCAGCLQVAHGDFAGLAKV